MKKEEDAKAPLDSCRRGSRQPSVKGSLRREAREANLNKDFQKMKLSSGECSLGDWMEVRHISSTEQYRNIKTKDF